MSNEPTRPRGGAGRGQGRKSLKPGEATVPVVIRMAGSQKDKLKDLGGPQWVRDKIDEAPTPEKK